VKSGISPQKYKELTEEFEQAEKTNKPFSGIEFAKICAYEWNKPWLEVWDMMERDRKAGILVPVKQQDNKLKNPANGWIDGES
jgi:hypothetical protein